MTQKNIILSFVIVIASFLGCSKNDEDENAPLTANKPPGKFTLVSVSNNSVEIDFKPTLLWSVALDPENDPVTYDIYLDSNNNPKTVVAENIDEISFQITNPLQFSRTFYWKVIAKDNKGNSTESSIYSFTTKNLFSQVTANAGFSERSGHTSVVFNNKIWVIGGFSYNLKNDVWSSKDGINWSEENSQADFIPRSSHASVVFKDKIWVIGGYSTSGYQSDVWSSTDGIKWTLVTPTAPFAPRDSHSTLVFDNKIWVIGGQISPLQVQSDVWNSTDGINWTQVSSDAFPARGFHTSIAFNNKIWVIAGLTNNLFDNDVWNSNDGITWTKVTTDVQFTKRYGHSTTVFDNKIWVIGGAIEDNNALGLTNDVWVSNNGSNWTRAISNAPFSARDRHTSLVLDDKLLVVGGSSVGIYKNDVWVMN